MDETRTQQILTYTDHKTGLEVRCEVTTFRDYPAVEWVLKLKNSGECETPIISDIQAIDTALTNEDGECKLHYASGVKEGVTAGADDFGPKTQLVPPNSSFEVSSPKSELNVSISPVIPFKMTYANEIILCLNLLQCPSNYSLSHLQLLQ